MNTLKFPTIFNTDSYKQGHWLMTPQNVSKSNVYWEARKNSKWNYTLFFGLQYILKDYFVGSVVTNQDVERLHNLIKAHVPNVEIFNIKGFERILNKHNGKLPIEIYAPKEGTLINKGNVIINVRSTDEEFPTIGAYFDSLLQHVWYPTLVATKSFFLKRSISRYVKDCDFNMHDFGLRACTCVDQAAIGGASHLINFSGSDTIPALLFIQHFYNKKDVAAFNIPANEHFVSLCFGDGAGEEKYIQSLLDKFPTGFLSILPDTYNTKNFVSKILPKFKEQIIARYENNPDKLSRLVIRPDSPLEPNEEPWEQVVWLHEELGKIFGYDSSTSNKKILHPSVGVIYSDGLSEAQIRDIYFYLELNGWDCRNQVVGMGGRLLQKGLDRDEISSAFKLSAYQENGSDDWVTTNKNPIDSSKKSKAGLLKLVKLPSGDFKTVSSLEDGFDEAKDELELVFKDGALIRDQHFDEIRAIAKSYL